MAIPLPPAPRASRRALRTLSFLLPALVALCLLTRPALAQEPLGQVDLPTPTGSSSFGSQVYTLTNGNFVVVDPFYSTPTVPGVGAVFLYDGRTLALISTLTGSQVDDFVGIGGVTVLTNGNFVVASYSWDNGSAADAGAVTWVNGESGLNGVVSPANSLVGVATDDFRDISGGYTAYGRVTALTNGNYVISTSGWDNGSQADAGAATWGNGTTGVQGVISSANSLVGAAANNRVGAGGVVALTNGNYVVSSPDWDNGSVANVGAATWGNGASGVSGSVGAANSLIGATAEDKISGRQNDNDEYAGIVALTNGHYVVSSPDWDNGSVDDAGAATWGNGSSGVKGAISAANSLVGSAAHDRVGIGALALTNGHYVVASYYGGQGATTWCNGSSGRTGTLSAAASLVGGGDSLMWELTLTALTNGNYVVSAPYWDNDGVLDAGAATWGNGSSGTAGTVSSANSLVGSNEDNRVGEEIVPLTNGNYIVLSRFREGGSQIEAGTVTWSSGASASPIGPVSTANSLVGYHAVTALSDGNYVIADRDWELDGQRVGAVSWRSGTAADVTPLSAANSVIGAGADRIGFGGVQALANGDYLIRSSRWNEVKIAGALTWIEGGAPASVVVTSTNSIVGTTYDAYVGEGTAVTLPGEAGVVVHSVKWNDGPPFELGAVTWLRSAADARGVITTTNSVLGESPYAGMWQVFAYDATNDQLIVGGSHDSRVTVMRPPRTLTVAKSGSGAGTITSAPAGIDCGAACSASFAHGTAITLTATADATSLFTGWSGACEGAGACVLTLDAARTVTATFGPAEFEVEIPVTAPGGTVRVEVVGGEQAGESAAVQVGAAGVDTPAATYPLGTVLRLTALPTDPNYFAGWEGDLDGTENPTLVTVTRALSIRATFATHSRYLPVVTQP